MLLTVQVQLGPADVQVPSTNIQLAALYLSGSPETLTGTCSQTVAPARLARTGSAALTPSSVLLLKALWERQEVDGLLLGYAVNGDSPVFRYRYGSPILPVGFTHAFKKIARRAGLEGYRLHDTRHAHATLMLRQGVHPKIVQERLGHAKVGTTLDIYSHITTGLQEAAALRFDEGLAGAKEPEPREEAA